MSLKEAYSLAHSAQCRLNIEASRPDRNLRFVVGHLMHYESLRLRIVEIEHDISRDQRAKAVQFQERMSGQKGSEGESRLRSQPSTGDLRKQQPRRKSPPPPPSSTAQDDEDDDELPDDLLADDDDEEEGLGLQRFPSGSARPPQPPPDLEPDDDEDEDEDDYDPPSPEEPSEAALHFAMRNQPNEQLAKSYSQVRGCPCHRSQAPAIDRLWELRDEKTAVEGRTRAVVEVAEGS
ncbi:hypothetical protein KC330_g7740 [Hortaea werneckii]|nr:hypothetical protein KC330_g7740 [Hortaea werneckii]